MQWVEDHDLYEIKNIWFLTTEFLTFLLITGNNKWFVSSGYIAPSDVDMVNELLKRKDQWLTGYCTLLLGACQ